MKNDNKKEFQEDLYLLKICYGKLVEILEAFCTSDFGIRNPELNHYYTRLQSIIDGLLELPYPEFQELLRQKPLLIDSLIGDINDLDVLWEHQYSLVSHEFNAQIERLFLEKGSKTNPLDKTTNDFLKRVDKATQHHREINKVEMDKIMFGNQILSCGNLLLDLRQAVLIYGNHPPIDISPDTSEIKFLSLLMRNKRLTEYVEIAKKLNMNCYSADRTNKEVAREVQFLKRDLNHILKKAGMTTKEINNTIVAKKNLGYKLNF